MKFAAHYIITGTGVVLRNGIAEVDREGRIVALIDNEGGLREQAGMEFHSGIICPAFPELPQGFAIEELFRKFPHLQNYRSDLPADLAGLKGFFNWVKNIQLRKPDTELSALISLFCREVGEKLHPTRNGTIEAGKSPGLAVISGVDYQQLRLTENARIRRLV